MSDNIKIQQANEISIKELVIVVKEWFFFFKGQWKILFISSIIGAIIGLGYSYIKKPNYISILTFALDEEKPGGGLSGAIGLASSLGIDLGTSAGGAFSGSNLIELLKSRTIIEKALLNPISITDGRSISLVEYYLEFTGIRETLSKRKQLENLHFSINDNRKYFSISKDSLLGEVYYEVVKNILSVSQKDKKVLIINVESSSKSELFSKALTENLVKEVSEYYVETKSKKARTNVQILQKQADSIRNELNIAISGVAQASDNVFNLNSALNVKRTPTTKKQIDVQANTAILTQLVTNLELAKVTLLKETPLIQIIDKPILPLKKEAPGKVLSLILGFSLFLLITIIYLVVNKIIKQNLY